MLPYDTLIMSDHRCISVDFDIKSLLGGGRTDPTKPSIRTLQIKSPQRVEAYISFLERYFKEHNIADKLKKCDDLMLSNPSNQNALDEYNQLQITIQRGQISTEKRCGHKPYGLPWSPILAQAGSNIIKLRHLRQKLKRGEQLTQIELNRWAFSCKPNVQWATSQLKQAWKIFKKAKAESEQLRDDFLEERATFYAELTDKSKTSILMSIKKSERIRNIYRKLNYISHPDKAKNIDRILIPDEDGNGVHTITDDETIHNILLDESKRYFQRTKTPYLLPHLSEIYAVTLEN